MTDTAVIQTLRKPGYSIEYGSWFISLTREVIALVDADMVPILAQHNWQASKHHARWVATYSYRSDGRAITVFMHREVMGAPDGLVVDHMEHHPITYRVIDNRRSNLRVCSRAENNRNLRPKSKSGTSPFKGVSFDIARNRWRAKIGLNGASKHLGHFEDELDAARAYDAAAAQFHGQFAMTNEKLGLLP